MEHSHSTKTKLYAQWNPCNVLDIPVLLVMRLEHPLGCVSKTQRNDCFSRLPWEITAAIAIKLPTDDALDLRRISQAFLPLLSSGIFWSSRFEASGGRGFVFEKRRSRDTTDWMSLYRLTSHTHSSPGLQIRRPIWDLSRQLTDLTSLHLAEGSKTACVHQQPACMRWSKVAGDVKAEASGGHPIGFNEGCRLIGTHVVHMPKDLSKIGFSISSVGNVGYVAGIRLINEKCPDMCLGFVSEGKEVVHEVTTLRGSF